MDVNIFWQSVQRGFENVNHHLIREKNIYLDDEHSDVLVIGISPQNKMSIAGRIESRANASFLNLNKKTLMELLQSVNDRFRENIVNIQSAQRQYKVIVDSSHMKLKLSSLLVLRRKILIVRKEIELLESEHYESQLFCLLEHFSSANNHETILRSLNTSRAVHLKFDQLKLIAEMCQLECKCLQKSFVLDIASNCLEWLVHCVPLYFKARYKQV